jgi:hypothetical protein
MANGWYELVNADVPITQGDIIFNCPLISWAPEPVTIDKLENLTTATVGIAADVVVLTQACDLEHQKVSNIILCPHLPLNEFKPAWEDEMRTNGQNPTPKAWRNLCNDICDGFVWNLTMLNAFNLEQYNIDIRVVDFHDVYTAPRSFLESLLTQRNEQRFRLLPPYREHLSQAFARFFMRVGLPVQIREAW